MQLYQLLPAVIRIRDALYQGANAESILRGIVYALEQESDTVNQQTSDLSKLVDTDNCPVRYLPFLADMLGLPPEGEWSEAKRRFFVESVVRLYKMSGQQLSWRKVLGFYGYRKYFPWELWKSIIYEVFDYSLFQDYTHRYKAARVDIRSEEDWYVEDILLGDIVYSTFTTSSPVTGASQNADDLPTGAVYRNGTLSGIVVVVVNRSTGVYSYSFDTQSCDEDDHISVVITATVTGVTQSFTLLNGRIDKESVVPPANFDDNLTLEAMRPIHVLIRRPGITVDVGVDDYYIFSDAEFYPSPSTLVNVVMVDNIPAQTDTLEMITTCLSFCETGACQTGCEGSACQVGPCQVWCDTVCQTTCEFTGTG